MKFFILAALCCLSLSAFAGGEERLVRAEIINQQQGLSDNKIWWQVQFSFNETVFVTSGPSVTLPEGWTNAFYNAGNLYPYCYEGLIVLNSKLNRII